MGQQKNDNARYLRFMGIMAVVIFIVAGGFTYFYVNQKITEDIKKDIALKSEYSSSQVKNLFENAKIHTSQMSINPLILEYLGSIQTRADIQKEPGYSQVLTLLRNIKNSSQTHHLVWVANEQGNFYFDNLGVLSDVTYEIEKRPWYPIAAGSKAIEFTSPYEDWGTGDLVLSSIQALRRNDDRIFGFVGVDVSIDSLPAIMNKAMLTSQDKIFMVGADGAYIYHQDGRKVLNQKISDPGDPLKDYSARILSTRQGLWEVTYEGLEMYLVCYPASETGWIIVSLIPKYAMGKELRQTATVVMMAIAFSLLSFYLLFLLLLKKITLASNLTEVSGCSQLEEEIQAKNIELAMQYHHIIEHEKMASLGSLVAGVTHEVNTPLGNCISTMTYLEQTNSNYLSKLTAGIMTKNDLQSFMEENNEGLKLLVSNLNRAADLIKSFKQLAVEQSSNQRTNFNLKETIQAVAMSLKHEYKIQGHQVIIECPEQLRIDSYPGIYLQIFTNFIMNTIHHGFNDKINGLMQFQCQTVGDRLIIIYSDNGCGIPAENLEHIFEMFFTTNRSRGNNGLGMHIVQTLVKDKLNGNIQCDSKFGEGVTFTIDVPLQLSETE